MFRDLNQATESITRAETTKFQSHVDRTIGRIESEIRDSKDLAAFVSQNPQWFEELWIATVRRMPDVLYGAILDVNKQSIENSDRLISSEGSSSDTTTLIPVPSSVSGTEMQSILPNSKLMNSTFEPNGKQVLDVVYAIRSGSLILGYYRVGMDFDLLQSKIAQARNKVIGGWAVMLLSIASIVFGACISLYRLGLHAVRLERQLGVAEFRRVDELHRLIVGLAHEIRNPLNAIRLNLFASKKILGAERDFDIEEASGILDESVEEIDRMDDLIGQLLGYARVVGKTPTNVDVNQQVDSVLKFFRRSLDELKIHSEFIPSPVNTVISMDPQSLRQVLINLFKNASQAMSDGGSLKVVVSSASDRVIVDVHDSGPGLEDKLLPRIFEPFFSTRENGVGMGLAVVKGLVESSNGRIRCEKSSLLGGMHFQIDLPSAAYEADEG